ncbi:response regulator [Brevibacillus sp. SYSU BS000544]|uniref:response regulator n=1 Tax=Brevibacillus sp. SYSU BS000544 TaxID=3416443 RepID=UPI003CE4EDD2
MLAKIIIVDDVSFMRLMLKNLLEEAGYSVIAEGTNGEEAVRLFKQYKPDLITMDITMPKLDGIKALMEIKKVDPNARVIMCSTMAQRKLVIHAIRGGANDFLVKPIQRENILSAVAKALKQ